MKVIIAGSRFYTTHFHLVLSAVAQSGFTITEVVSGGANGIDLLGEKWAKENDIPIKTFEAKWNQHGKGAGPIRNQLMVDYADALIAIPHEIRYSVGTQDVIKKAQEKGIPVYVHGGK